MGFTAGLLPVLRGPHVDKGDMSPMDAPAHGPAEVTSCTSVGVTSCKSMTSVLLKGISEKILIVYLVPCKFVHV